MTTRTPSQERTFNAINGWLPLLGTFAAWAALIAYLIVQVSHEPERHPLFWVVFGLSILVSLISLFGYFLVNPNTSRVLVLFGKYRGSVRTDGFFWTNPFTIKHKVSLKAHNIASEKIKVNDLSANPIEIGAVVVWQVNDTAQASFDVENYFEYVDVQIEAAVRTLAKEHPYDDRFDDSDVPSLRGDTEGVTQKLQNMLQERLERAGLAVIEARISHLAYAPEIASAMLQRQQASAVIAARKLIVEGAVTMVEDALEQLSAREVVELDAERRATLVGNLLVVLCGGQAPTPVLNTGSLYN
ncbi:MAG: membrane protein [Planctomycetota bacterium]|nr:MAG: membrane protein [Planctomycetota bacterium]